MAFATEMPVPGQPAADDQDSLTVLAALPEQSQGVSPIEIVRIALGSLLANKVRSLLTMLGVIIGVASVVALLSLGSGASASITGQIESIGTNLLTISPGQQNGGPGSGGAAQNLSLSDSAAIAALGLPIVGPAPQYSASADLVAPAADTRASVVGTTAAYQQINSLTLRGGQFFSDDQVSAADSVVVLGATLAEELFGSGQAVGQRLRIDGQSFRVIGVLNAEGGGGFGSVDDQAFVPISAAQGRLFGARTPDGNDYQVSSIAISVASADDIAFVKERVSMLLRERHGLASDGGEDDFSVMDQSAFLDTLTTVTDLLTLFLGAVAAISLVVGGIGIMNIMLVSVTERTREIGLRKAVGARGGDIMLQFVVEALVLSLAGGLIGLAFGSLIPTAVTLLGLLEAPVTLSAALLALSFSLAVGLFFGIYPARRAARLDPIEALRSE